MSAISLSRMEEVWESWLGDRTAACEGDHAGLEGEQHVLVCSPEAGEGSEGLFWGLRQPGGLVVFFCEGSFSSLDVGIPPVLQPVANLDSLLVALKE